MTARPDFTSIASFGGFSEYYRYRAEPAAICRTSATAAVSAADTTLRPASGTVFWRTLARTARRAYSPRLRTAAALWAQVRASCGEKAYSHRLPDENRELLSQYSEENNGAGRQK